MGVGCQARGDVTTWRGGELQNGSGRLGAGRATGGEHLCGRKNDNLPGAGEPYERPEYRKSEAAVEQRQFIVFL